MGRPRVDLEHTAFYPEIRTATIDISSDDQVSEAVDLDGTHLFALATPSSFTSTAITFQVSADNSTFVDLYDDTGTQYSVTVAPSYGVFLPPSNFAGFRYIKLVAGSAEAADRDITLFTRSG